MILGSDGQPTSHDGPTGRAIVITEEHRAGKPVWGVAFHPTIGHFEFEEVMMILCDVPRGIAQQALSRVREHKAMNAVKQKLGDIK